MESLILIKYKWDMGIYSLEQIIRLVKNKILTKQDFFYITRFNYNGLIRKLKKMNKKI